MAHRGRGRGGRGGRNGGGGLNAGGGGGLYAGPGGGFYAGRGGGLNAGRGGGLNAGRGGGLNAGRGGGLNAGRGGWVNAGRGGWVNAGNAGGGGGRGPGGGLGHFLTRDQAKRLVQQENLRFRLPAQVAVGALSVFHVPEMLTPLALQQYSHARSLYNQQTYQLKLDVRLPAGVVQVPVTPAPIQQLEDTRHFLVEIRGAGSMVRIAVDESSGYSVAFQELRDTDVDFNIIPWCQLKGSGHLPSKFLLKIFIDYDVSYTPGELDVTFDENTGPGMFQFLKTFRDNPSQNGTPQGRKHLDTLFVLVNEIFRFGFIERWAAQYGVLGAAQSRLIRNYSSISEMVFMLVLYLIERQTADNNPGDRFLDMIAEMDGERAQYRLARLQFKLQDYGFNMIPRVASYVGDEPIFVDSTFQVQNIVLDEVLLGRLTGGNDSFLKLLKYDKKRCDRILMRRVGYIGLL